MKYLIVNGDDFGASPGVNHGILEAHRRGILTSTSLFVDRPASRAAVALARDVPTLSIGLHAELDGTSPEQVRAELLRQLGRFVELVGRPPTHLDSHHHVHRAPDIAPTFLAIAAMHQLLVRDFSHVRYVSEFYGHDAAESVGVERCIAVVQAHVDEGVTEIGCHPGYVDDQLRSSYRREREWELETLCDARVRAAVDAAGITLVGFDAVSAQLTSNT